MAPRFFGLIFLAAGLIIIFLAITNPELFDVPLAVGILFGVAFMMPGLAILEAHKLWPGFAVNVNWQAMWTGLCSSTMGLLIIVLSIVDPNEASFHAPRWVVTLAGAIFLLAGLSVINFHALGQGYRQDSLVAKLLSAVLVTCFGAVVTWVSLGPGEREFKGFLETPIGWFQLAPNELVGRLIFTPGALILDGLALYLWVQMLDDLTRYWRSKF